MSKKFGGGYEDTKVPCQRSIQIYSKRLFSLFKSMQYLLNTLLLF